MLPDGESSSLEHLLSLNNVSIRAEHQVGRDGSLVTVQTPDSKVKVMIQTRLLLVEFLGID